MSGLTEKTIKLQQKLAGYCRDGQITELPVDSEFRLRQYRRLVFNVIKGTMTQAYPIAAKLLGTEAWNELLHDFFAHHSCQHPQVWRMPRELIDYVNESDYNPPIEMAYFRELLRMEWLEIEVHSMPDQPIPEYSSIQNPMNSPLVLNPYHVIERFDFPVHRVNQISPSTRPGHWYLLIYRNIETDKVHFTQIDPLSAAIVSSLYQNPGASPIEVYEALCNAQGSTPEDRTIRAIETLLSDLQQRKFVLGRIKN